MLETAWALVKIAVCLGLMWAWTVGMIKMMFLFLPLIATLPIQDRLFIASFFCAPMLMKVIAGKD